MPSLTAESAAETQIRTSEIGFPVALKVLPADIQAVIEAIVALSRLGARANWIAELDVNPLMVGPRGWGCMVVDALIVAADRGAG